MQIGKTPFTSGGYIGNVVPAVIEVSSTVSQNQTQEHNGITVGPFVIDTGYSYTVATGKRLVIL